MLRSLKDLEHYAIGAVDGPIGNVDDFLFDDFLFVVRYLVIETGHWLNSRKVLISPVAIREPRWEDKTLTIDLTRDLVKHAPNIDTHKSVTRQHETEYSDYYRYSYYWGGGGLWGAGLYPNLSSDFEGQKLANRAYSTAQRKRKEKDDPHLRSCKAVISYRIHAVDGEIGFVSDLLVDEQVWAVRYLVIDTSSWFGGHKVLVSPEWIERVSWAEQTIEIDLLRIAIKNAPHFESTEQLSRDAEIAIYSHVDRPQYWSAL